MRIIFAGTPLSALPFLEYLNQEEKIVSVITQPDKSGEILPVKQYSLENKLTIHQPLDLKEKEFISKITDISADLGVVVSYGKILPGEFLSTTKFGWINVHFSILPKFRGAAPIQRAIINGDKETGVTVFWIDEGMDTGKIISQSGLLIETGENAINLQARLISLGLEALKKSIYLINQNPKIGIPQEGEISYAPSLKKEDGKIDWSKSATEIDRHIRGLQPWPGSYTCITQTEKILKILSADPLADKFDGSQAGEIVGIEKNSGFIVKCKNSSLLVKQVQLEGKKSVPAWQFWQGARLSLGTKLG